MRLVKIFLMLAVVALATGCSCKTNRIGDGPFATEAGPLADVNYAFDSYALDATAKAKLDDNADWLETNDDTTVTVEGHCDERGTNEYNMALGMKRAQSALDYLTAKGLDASRAKVVSYGEDLPLEPEHNEAAWKRNRRVHFDVKFD